MDQLADQASDLRSFLNNPAPSAMGSSPGRNDYTPSPGAAGTGFVGPAVGLGGPTPGSPQSLGDPSRSQPYLAHHSPSSAYGDNSAHQEHQQHQLHNPSEPGNKRKSAEDDTSAKQQRSKRNRYIPIACNECKRRKIKCNGNTPCFRCGNLGLKCIYSTNCCTSNFKDSDAFKEVTAQVARLQEQVDGLVSQMTALRQETTSLRLAPIQDRVLPLPSHTVTPSPSTSSIRSLPKPPLPGPRVLPSFSGPTSINFTVDMAKNTLHNMGYSTVSEGQGDAGGATEASPAPSPRLNPLAAAASSQFPALRPTDPLWDFDKNELVRLCRVHEEEVGIMYPVIDIDDVIEHAKVLASWMENARKHGMARSFGQDEGINDMKTCTLKIVMCCGLVVEEHGCSAKAAQLYESIRPVVDRKLMSEPVDLDNIPFLALVAGYRFLSNEEILAWRVIGQVCRLCLELGLHRREGLAKIQDEAARRNALLVFWSAYILDRRWSFGTGLPYVCDDEKIDPKLPLPDSHPYLVAMITYSRLGAKIWKLVDYFEPAVIRELQRREFDQLDSEILDWYETVPSEIKVASLNRDTPMPSGPAYDTKRLQIWTRLRLNQIRIWLHTPVLHSASSIVENMPLAQRAVDLAKETIRYMTHMNNTSNLYRRNQVFYHQFLTSAIAVLFLASTHAPLRFSSQCRTEFYMALELVKDLSARSWVSQRLWRTVRGLKAYAPRLGLGEETDDLKQLSGAATAVTGLVSGAAGMGGLGASTANRSDSQSPMPTLPMPGSRSFSLSGSRPLPAGAIHQFNSSQAGHGRSAVTVSPMQKPVGGIGEDQNNGQRLKTEMTAIFETYHGLRGRLTSAHGSRQQMHPNHAAPAMGAEGMVLSSGDGLGGVEEGVYQVFRDLF